MRFFSRKPPSAPPPEYYFERGEHYVLMSSLERTKSELVDAIAGWCLSLPREGIEPFLKGAKSQWDELQRQKKLEAIERVEIAKLAAKIFGTDSEVP